MVRRTLIAIAFVMLLSIQSVFAATSVSIIGTHIVDNNSSLKTGQHTFVLTALNDCPMPEGSVDGVKKVVASSNEPFSFGEIVYSADGTYDYIVSRETEPSDRLNEDDSSYKVRVSVENDAPTVIYERVGDSGKSSEIIYKDYYYCILTFNLNGGELHGTTSVIQKKYKLGDTINLPNAPKKDGYAFDYWKGSKYYAGEEYTVTEDHEFTAMYTKTADNKSDSNSNNSANNSTKNKSTNAKTGDDRGILLYMALFLVVAFMMIGIRLKRR